MLRIKNKNQLIIFYDDYCPNCTRFAKLVKKLDWCHLITTQKIRELSTQKKSAPQNQDDFLFSNLDVERAEKQMASCEMKNLSLGSTQEPKNFFYGFVSIYKIFLRLPLYWIFFFYTWPFLYLTKISRAGDFIYNQIAVKRKIVPLHCHDACEFKNS